MIYNKSYRFRNEISVGMITPTKADFLENVRQGSILPLYREVPYSAPHARYEAFCSENSFLLESVKGPLNIARYSFIGTEPPLVFRAKNGIINLSSQARHEEFRGDPLSILKTLVASYRQKTWDGLPPFQGGLAGLLSYDFAQYLEQLPARSADDTNLPDAHFFVCNKVIAFDHKEKKCWIIVCPGIDEMLLPVPSTDWNEHYAAAEDAVEALYRKAASSTGHTPAITDRDFPRRRLRSNGIDIVYEMRKRDYTDMVRRAKEYIAAGDIFQANLSQRVSAQIGERNPWDLYKILRRINPSPFAAFMHFGNYQIVSSSPERLVRTKDRIIETRPIAGTRPRGMNAREDEILRCELLLNEKERAEHIMLIDLERNDIGRVSDYGSVKVDELMITEDYSHVIHIVSNITGKFTPGKDCFDVIQAAFPGGTITGVPKVRCMEIIDELEPVRRGPYTGSVGYIGFSGNMDLNIIIRSFVIKGGSAYVQAGAGIVADSEAEREYGETLKKAEALLKTLEMI